MRLEIRIGKSFLIQIHQPMFIIKARIIFRLFRRPFEARSSLNAKSTTNRRTKKNHDMIRRHTLLFFSVILPHSHKLIVLAMRLNKLNEYTATVNTYLTSTILNFDQNSFISLNLIAFKFKNYHYFYYFFIYNNFNWTIFIIS